MNDDSNIDEDNTGCFLWTVQNPRAARAILKETKFSDYQICYKFADIFFKPKLDVVAHLVQKLE